MNLLLFAADLAPGLAGGRYPAPAWLIWIAAGLVVTASVALLVVRARRARKDSAGPGDRRP